MSCAVCKSPSTHSTHGVYENEVQSQEYCAYHYQEKFGGRIEFVDEAYCHFTETLSKLEGKNQAQTPNPLHRPMSPGTESSQLGHSACQADS